MGEDVLDLKKIKIHDAFWNKHVQLVREAIIPYQWEAINDRLEGVVSSHSLENFKIAARRSQGHFWGMVFQDTDVAKWLEAVGFVLATHPDKELEQIADEVIDILGEAQGEDGYLNTYYTLVEPTRRWKDLCEGHELYTAGHLMEAACAYYLATGKEKFLQIMERNADLICQTFGPLEGQIHGYPGHQEVEIGLIKLYQITKKQRYLEMAKYFIDARGVGENYFMKEMKAPDFHLVFPEFKDYEPSYSQSHEPVREQKTAEGHAVRAMYMYSAMADLAYLYEDETLINACKRLWDNIVQKRLYLTGSVGSSGYLERFTADYDLPNDRNYSETCASIGLMMFAKRMNHYTKDAQYIDVLERALYNTVLAGIALDGKSFFYVNPLEIWPENCLPHTSMAHVKTVRQKWFGVACCPPNIARTLASLGQYIYDVEESTLYVHLFISNESELVLKEQSMQIQIETRFPWENSLNITCSKVPREGVMLAIRIPDYAKDYQVMCEGVAVPYEKDKGYAKFWLKQDGVVNILFESKPRFVRSHPSVRADSGKLALLKGPLVYCLEEMDNGQHLANVFVSAKQELIETVTDRPCEMSVLRFKGQKIKENTWSSNRLYDTQEVQFESVDLCAIPYAYWNNRGENEMCVWMKEWFC